LLVEEAGDVERERLPGDATVEDERTRAERTPRDDERPAADDVVHDLVQRQQLHRIGTRIAPLHRRRSRSRSSAEAGLLYAVTRSAAA